MRHAQIWNEQKFPLNVDPVKTKCFANYSVLIFSMKIWIFSRKITGRLKYVCFMLFPIGNYEVITFGTIIKNFYHGNIENFLKKVNGR